MAQVDPIDRSSEAWTKINSYIEARIEELRDQIEHPVDAVDTATLRGRISELRALVSAATPRLRPDDGDTVGAEPLY